MRNELTPIGTKPSYTELSYWDRPEPGPLWRRLLSRGNADATGLRWWALWIWWSKPRSSNERLHATIDLLLSPLAALNDARAHVKRHGGKVTQLYGVSAARQFGDLVRLRLHSGLPSISYYKYQLFLPERREAAHQYIEDAGRFLQVLKRRIPVADDADIFSDKRSFERWCRAQDLPGARILLEVDGETILYRANEDLPAADLFSKPSNWRSGKGVERWLHALDDAGVSTWTGSDGMTRNGDELYAFLKQRSLEYGRPLILQPLITNHPDIGALGNGALCTLRVMTLRPTRAAEAELLLAVLRIAAGNAPADNFDLGGMAAPVDIATGRCGKAISKRGDYPVDRFEANPENGRRIEGLELPFWREAMALAVHAHGLVQYDLPVVGWDIAVTKDGPVLIEANDLPCGNVAQMPTGVGLGATHYASYVLSCLRAAFKTG